MCVMKIQSFNKSCATAQRIYVVVITKYMIDITIPSVLCNPHHPSSITSSFKSVTMLCGNNNILQNIPNIQSECLNIPQNIVSRKENCDGSE